jgi:hypothetical protein
MTNAMLELKWFEFRKRILHWWNRHRNEKPGRIDHARERSISILQKRYGYTREEATSQLDKHYSKAWLG